jgi:hypothetical protein
MANLPGTLTSFESRYSDPDQHFWDSNVYGWSDKDKIYGVFLCNEKKNGIVYVNRSIINADKNSIRTHDAIFRELYKIGYNNSYKTLLKFYPKYVQSDYEKLSKVGTGMSSNVRKSTRAGRIWKHDENTFIVCFWCEESRIDKNYLDIILKAFKIKSIFWSGINSKYYYEYTKGQTAVAVKSSVQLKSKVSPSLTQRQIIDILVKAHTTPNKLTPIEKKVVDEFRGSQAYADAKSGMGGYDIAAKYHYYSRTSEDRKLLSFKDYIAENNFV